MEENEFQRLIKLSHERRGDKASKFSLLEPAAADIQKLVNADVALTVIRDWLEEKQDIKVVLNTLRKFVVLHIGRETYDLYLRRNGWAKSVRKGGAGNPANPLSTNSNQRAAVRASKAVSDDPNTGSQLGTQSTKSVLIKGLVDKDEMYDYFRDVTKIRNREK